MSQTFDPARLTARFKKGPASFKIEVLEWVGAERVGVYPDPGSKSKLLWSPPELSKPRTIDVTNQNHTFALEAGHDYIIPSAVDSADGKARAGADRRPECRDHRWRDPRDDPISPPTGVNSAYGISLYRQTGTVHIEGVWVHGRGIGQAILIADLITGGGSPDSVVQIENSQLDAAPGGDTSIRMRSNPMADRAGCCSTRTR